jgi:hypothetical protein
MKLIRVQESPSETGETLSTWALSGEQYHILLNYAINDLVMKGLIEVSDLTKEEIEVIRQEMVDDTNAVFGEATSDIIVPGKTIN